MAPIGLMLVPPVPSGRSFWVELSAALGFVGLTQIGIQFVLIARFKPLTYPFGIAGELAFRKSGVCIDRPYLNHPTNDPYADRFPH